jgi:hypothetical protein
MLAGWVGTSLLSQGPRHNRLMCIPSSASHEHFSVGVLDLVIQVAIDTLRKVLSLISIHCI